MIRVGAIVVSGRGFSGTVVARRGAPGGRAECAVATEGVVPELRWLDEERLTVLPSPPPAALGEHVRCYGQQCEVISFDAEANRYELLSVVPLRSGRVVALHRYPAVPAHHIMRRGEP